MLIFFRIETITAFPTALESVLVTESDTKYIYSSGANFVEPLIIIPGAPSSATDWEGLRGFVAFKMPNCKMGGNKNSHWTNDHSDSQWRSTVNRLELFCRNCSYLKRFNCVRTVYIKMHCIGIVFGDSCTYLQNLVGWVWYHCICCYTGSCVRLNCILNKEENLL